MKTPLKLLLAGLLALASALPAAKSKNGDDGPEVLFEPKSMFPAQGGPGLELAIFGNTAAILVGGIGSLDLGGGLGIGLAGYSLSTELTTTFNGAVHDVGLSYGGVVVENSFFQRKLFYLKVSTLVGTGQAYAVARQVGSERDRALFFLAEPSFEWMLNVTREARIGLGLGYRLIAGANVADVTGIDMQGWSGKATLYYGKL